MSNTFPILVKDRILRAHHWEVIYDDTSLGSPSKIDVTVAHEVYIRWYFDQGLAISTITGSLPISSISSNNGVMSSDVLGVICGDRCCFTMVVLLNVLLLALSL